MTSNLLRLVRGGNHLSGPELIECYATMSVHGTGIGIRAETIGTADPGTGAAPTVEPWLAVCPNADLRPVIDGQRDVDGERPREILQQDGLFRDLVAAFVVGVISNTLPASAASSSCLA